MSVPTLKKPRIIAVDDDKEMLRFLSEHLSARGFEIETASSGGEAIEKARNGRYDVMICDLKMPVVDGISCMEAVTKMDPSLHVIFLSGEATIDKAVNAMKKGACDFLQKPVSMEKLLLCIDHALGLKQVYTNLVQRIHPPGEAAA